jgi:thymidylate kinase
VPTKIIAIEGVDGVGKSTLCKYIAEKHQAKNIFVIKTPEGSLKQLCKISRLTNDNASFNAFLLADLAIVVQAQNVDWLIVDRYILSTLVYHHQFILDSQIDVSRILKEVGLTPPSLTIYLYCSFQTIFNRLRTRNIQANHRLGPQQTVDLFENYLSNQDNLFPTNVLYRHQSEQLTDIEHCADWIMNFINNYDKGGNSVQKM